MCLARDDNYFDDKRVSREILGDDMVSVCLDIGDV